MCVPDHSNPPGSISWRNQENKPLGFNIPNFPPTHQWGRGLTRKKEKKKKRNPSLECIFNAGQFYADLGQGSHCLATAGFSLYASHSNPWGQGKDNSARIVLFL